MWNESVTLWKSKKHNRSEIQAVTWNILLLRWRALNRFAYSLLLFPMYSLVFVLSIKQFKVVELRSSLWAKYDSDWWQNDVPNRVTHSLLCTPCLHWDLFYIKKIVFTGKFFVYREVGRRFYWHVFILKSWSQFLVRYLSIQKGFLLQEKRSHKYVLLTFTYFFSKKLNFYCLVFPNCSKFVLISWYLWFLLKFFNLFIIFFLIDLKKKFTCLSRF